MSFPKTLSVIQIGGAQETIADNLDSWFQDARVIKSITGDLRFSNRLNPQNQNIVADWFVARFHTNTEKNTVSLNRIDNLTFDADFATINATAFNVNGSQLIMNSDGSMAWFGAGAVHQQHVPIDANSDQILQALVNYGLLVNDGPPNGNGS